MDKILPAHCMFILSISQKERIAIKHHHHHHHRHTFSHPLQGGLSGYLMTEPPLFFSLPLSVSHESVFTRYSLLYVYPHLFSPSNLWYSHWEDNFYA